MSELLTGLFKKITSFDYNDEYLYICINALKIIGYVIGIIFTFHTFLIISNLFSLILIIIFILYSFEYISDFINNRIANQDFFNKAGTLFIKISSFVFSLVLIFNFILSMNSCIPNTSIYFLNILFTFDFINSCISNSVIISNGNISNKKVKFFYSFSALFIVTVSIVMTFFGILSNKIYVFLFIIPSILNVFNVFNIYSGLYFISEPKFANVTKLSFFIGLIGVITTLISFFSFREMKVNENVKKTTIFGFLAEKVCKKLRRMKTMNVK